MATQPAPYLLLFRDSTPEIYRDLSAEQRQRMLTQWNQWYNELEATGCVRYGHPLEPEGRMVSISPGRLVTDEPLVEAHRAIGGYFFLMVADLLEATAIARRCPSLSYGMHVEVRPVADCCHLGATSRPESTPSKAANNAR